MDYDHTHPERHHPGLVFAPRGKLPDEVREQRKGLRQLGNRHNSVELCWACGWNAYHEINSGYAPRIKIFHTRNNIGIWAIGSQWLIRDQPNDATLGNDYMTQQFLRGQPALKIPLIKEMRLLSNPTDQIQFTLMSRAQGVRLNDIWHTLTPTQKSGYTSQLSDVLKQLRRFTAPVPQKVDGSQLDDVLMGYCARRQPPTCKKIGHTTEEWFANIAEELRSGLSTLHSTKDPNLIEAKLQELKDNFPTGEPYVLTHADLNLTNIIVKDEKIEAILDWEMAGYYPWWAERWSSLFNASNASDELFDAVWADVCPEMDEDAFFEQVRQPVGDVEQVYQTADRDHPNHFTAWKRPGFCECKPFAGQFLAIDYGQPLEHKVKDWTRETPDKQDDGLAKELDAILHGLQQRREAGDLQVTMSILKQT
ncbi:MAG: hypothetical protein Q9160_008680 [Pyrenula sp. 1 TL-2023]